jgi:hypothetical protein
MSQEQHERDARLLREIVDDPNVRAQEVEVFADMLDRIVERHSVLTPKQRKWANDVAERLGVEPSEGAEEAIADTRFTEGAVPRGREVESLVTGRASKPPGRGLD